MQHRFWTHISGFINKDGFLYQEIGLADHEKKKWVGSVSISLEKFVKNQDLEIKKANKELHRLKNEYLKKEK